MKKLNLISFVVMICCFVFSCTNPTTDKRILDSIAADSMKKLSLQKQDSIPKEGHTINYIDAKGIRQGYWKIFGKMQKDSTYSPDAIVKEGNYKDGKEEGKWIEYSSSQEKSAERNYKNGIELK